MFVFVRINYPSAVFRKNVEFWSSNYPSPPFLFLEATRKDRIRNTQVLIRPAVKLMIERDI
jgi:hypothetical protein